MKLNWKWIFGTVLILVVIFALPFAWRLFMPYGAYGMTRGYAYGMHMPMMGYGWSMMPFGMLLMWLIPLGTLVLIILGITWLVKQLTTKTS